jgi:hypothetical protein
MKTLSFFSLLKATARIGGVMPIQRLAYLASNRYACITIMAVAMATV